MAQILLSSVILWSILLLTLGRSSSFNSSVPDNSVIVKNDTTFDYMKIFNFWKEHQREVVSYKKHEEVVLVMGNTGTGKTTLTSALVGKELKVEKRAGSFLIVDEEGRIGISLLSQTLVPEVMIDNKRNVTYVDCAGFNDNRDFGYKISTVYYQKMLMDQVEKIKLLLVVNYDSLTPAGSKTDFDDLLKHLSEFVDDFSKFHNGIALVATKVPRTYEDLEDGTTQFVDDQTVLEGVADYLKEKKEIYHNNTDNLEKYQMFRNLIDVLLQKNNNSYSRIAIIRRPTGKGILTKNIMIKNEIDLIAKMIMENLRYIKGQKDDFSFALTPSLKVAIGKVLDDIYTKNIANHISLPRNRTLEHYLQIEKTYNEIKLLNDQMSYGYYKIADLTNFDKPEKLFEKLLNVINSLNIPIYQINLNAIHNDLKTLRFFTTVWNPNERNHIDSLKIKMQNIVNSMRNSSIFYSFLNNLQNNLASYDSQKWKNHNFIKTISATSINSTYKVVRDISDLNNFVKDVGYSGNYQDVETVQLNPFRLKHLKAIIDVFGRELTRSCRTSTLYIEGYNVKMSDVIQSNCWEQAQSVQIFALNKLFIDQSVIKIGAKEFIILAPIWEVIGNQKIILDGKAGELHRNPSAKSAISHLVNGSNGLPGHSGGPAGNFFGVGEKFINAEKLEIHANGGEGGPGQHGGNGADGNAGTELNELFFKIDQYYSDVEKYLKDYNYTYDVTALELLSDSGGSEGPPSGTRESYMITVSGKPANKSSNGGDGGPGGNGGCPGNIIITGLGRPIPIKILNEKGSTGLNGIGGIGGKETHEGRKVEFKFTYKYTIFLIALGSKYTNIKWTPGAIVPAGMNGKNGSTVSNKECQNRPTMPSQHSAINSFKRFVRMNLFENIEESKLRTFFDEFENNYQIEAQYNTLAYVNELEELENQYLQLKNKIDFIPFYNSLLRRIEKYCSLHISKDNNNLSQKDDKKVLSFIYTAALTKLSLLKKTRKSRTVVNLPRYLDILMSSMDNIDTFSRLKIVQNHENDYEKILNTKVQEANNFIENTIMPEIDKLWDECDDQIKSIANEINENKNSTQDKIEVLERNIAKTRNALEMRTLFGPLKLAASFLSFTGPINAAAGVALTTTASMAEGALLDSTSSTGDVVIYKIDPNLKSVSRVTEVINNKHQLATEKLRLAMEELEKFEKELSTSEEEKKREIKSLKGRLHEATFRKTVGFSESIQKLSDIEKITKEMHTLTSSEKALSEKKQEEAKKIKDIKKEKKYEKRLRSLNHVQSILNSAEIVFSIIQKVGYDQQILSKINDQISEGFQQLNALEEMEKRVFDVILPDIRQIEKTMNEATSLMKGSSHAKLDITKWQIRTSLRNVKSLLQKFTQKMSFELQNNLQRFMDKIEESFSVLIDIYDRIDSYADNKKQAEYIAHIESASMDATQVADSKLRKSVNDLKLIIHSNILTERYEIALFAFKQHYFPFAAHFLQKFKLPANVSFQNTEILRSKIVTIIKNMKDYISENEGKLSEYSDVTFTEKIFDSNTIGSVPFYEWKHDTIRNDLQQLLNGSEIVIKADISKGPFYNAIKYNDIGINFNLKNKALQDNFTSVLKNFKLYMKIIGNNYYRCGERYYSVSFDDGIKISYILTRNKKDDWIDPNETYTLIRRSHTFLSPYGMWSIKLQSANASVSFDHLSVYANETIDVELVGQGYCINQNTDFNLRVCNEYLSTFYNDEQL